MGAFSLCLVKNGDGKPIKGCGHINLEVSKGIDPILKAIFAKLVGNQLP